MTEQYELRVQKLEIKIERKFFFFPYHLHMSFVTIVVCGLRVEAAVPSRVRGHLAPLQCSCTTYQWEGNTSGAARAPHKTRRNA